MCHVGAAVCGTWKYPSNRSNQWKHLKVQSLPFFAILFCGSKRENNISIKSRILLKSHVTTGPEGMLWLRKNKYIFEDEKRNF